MEVGLPSTAPGAAQENKQGDSLDRKGKYMKKKKIVPSSEFFLKEIFSLSYIGLLQFGFLGKEQD